jgi:hypothetical protein
VAECVCGSAGCAFEHEADYEDRSDVAERQSDGVTG